MANWRKPVNKPHTEVPANLPKHRQDTDEKDFQISDNKARPAQSIYGRGGSCTGGTKNLFEERYSPVSDPLIVAIVFV
jgi:hypothetical protein